LEKPQPPVSALAAPTALGAGGRAALSAACAVLAALLVWLLPGLQLLEERSRDALTSLAATAGPVADVVVIDISEESLKRVGTWPWSRARLADLVEELVGPLGARGVALDMVLPEVADAAGDAVRVVRQLGVALQRDDLRGRGPGEPFQVQLLAARDDGQHRANVLAIRGGEARQLSKDFFDPFQQAALSRRTLAPRQFAKVQTTAGLAQNPAAQGTERLQPLRQRDDLGIGDRVGGPCEQVGQADLRPDRAGQDAQGQVERARDVPQQGKKASYRRSGTVCGGARPAVHRSAAGGLQNLAPARELPADFFRARRAEQVAAGHRFFQIEE